MKAALHFPWPAAASARPLSPPARAAAPASGLRLAYLIALMLAAMSYQLALCFLHTRYGLGGNGLVIAAELLMVAAALPLLLPRLPLGFCVALVLLMANGLALALMRHAIDPKVLRDFLVPLLFLGVGLACGDEATADRVLRWTVPVVLAVALFEFCFLDLFTRYFDVYSYYLARGVGDPSMGEFRSDKLVASGMRPEAIGRTLLPFLGSHRASSVFIEPVSLGNFAAVLAAWGLAKDRSQWLTGAAFVLAAAAMVVLSDSRFGVGALALMLILRLVLVRGSEGLGAIFPALAVATLIAAAYANGSAYSDSYVGRLAETGQTLLAMDLPELLGIDPAIKPYYDMGYPYVLSRNGLVAVLALWAAWWAMDIASPTGRRFRALAALYVALILCVSGTSFFAFKTSAMLGLLLGCGAASGKSAAGSEDARRPRRAKAAPSPGMDAAAGVTTEGPA